MTTRRAGCSCGELQVETTGEPVRVSVCHYLACQRRTGDSGQTVTYHFCPACGSSVYYQLEKAPDLLAIPIGAFADPQFPMPQFSFYESRQYEWVTRECPLERSD